MQCLGAARDTAYVLEPRPRARSVPAGDYIEQLSADPGDSRNAGAQCSGAEGRLRGIRFRVRELISDGTEEQARAGGGVGEVRIGRGAVSAGQGRAGDGVGLAERGGAGG